MEDKLIEVLTTEVIRTLDVSDKTDYQIRCYISKINEWFREYSEGHLTIKCRPVKGWEITSDSKNWRGYKDPTSDKFIIEKIIREAEIIPAI